MTSDQDSKACSCDVCLIERLIAALGERKAAELLDAIRADHLERLSRPRSRLPDGAGFDFRHCRPGSKKVNRERKES